MQFDQTRIPIQERGFLQLMDLGLRIAREHALAMFLTSLGGAAPFFFFNDWLLGERITGASLDETWDYTVFFFWMPVLIWWQIPLSSVFTTLYLGQVLFMDQFSFKKLVREALGSWWQLFLYQVLLRGWPLIFCALTILIPVYELEVFARVVTIVVSVVWMAVPHFWFPYLNEIILLERNPLKQKGIHGLSTWLRRKRLHAQYGTDLMGRWIISMMYAALLVVSVWMAIVSVRFYMLSESYDAIMVRYLLPIAVWVVVSYFNIVRFLSYLDLRIRNEGWEIDLRLRAEGLRLTRQIT